MHTEDEVLNNINYAFNKLAKYGVIGSVSHYQRWHTVEEYFVHGSGHDIEVLHKKFFDLPVENALYRESAGLYAEY